MMPRFCKPMLATLTDKPFDNSEWVYEIKWDGFRLLARVERGKVVLWSRNGINITKKYPVIAAALRNTKRSCLLDGELVALDNKGRSRFELLQNALRAPSHLEYVVFDLLWESGRDVRSLTLTERKARLKALLPYNRRIVYSEHIARRGVAMFKEAKRQGLEGVIAKRAAGRYHSGRRTREWLKFKAVMEQEVVIVGYTDPKASRKYFGALLLAVRDKKNKCWRYAGRAGTGFGEASLRDIYAKLAKIKTDRKPIADKVPDEAHTHWVAPRLVGEVKFTEWTNAGEMRHPAFLGLRTDKKPTEVIRERA